MGVPQGASFGGGDDDADRTAPAPGRNPRFRQSHRRSHGRDARRADLRFRARRACVHAAQRQYRADAVPDDLGTSAPQPHLAEFHGTCRAGCSRARRTIRSITRPGPSISTRTSALRWRSGTGLFGTLYIPAKEPEGVTFGVGETHGDYDTVLRTFVRPFVHSAEQLAPHGRRRRTTPASVAAVADRGRPTCKLLRKRSRRGYRRKNCIRLPWRSARDGLTPHAPGSLDVERHDPAAARVPARVRRDLSVEPRRPVRAHGPPPRYRRGAVSAAPRSAADAV